MTYRNNRSFFRINAMIQCGYRILSAEEARNKQIPNAIDAAYMEKYFLENFNELDEQIKKIVVTIGQKSDLLAKALAALNGKINFIVQTVNVKQLAQTVPLRMVNISAGGIQFKINQKVSQDNKIEVLMQLSSTEDPIISICDIVNSSSERDGSTLASLKYNNLSENDIRKIIYFIQNKEIEYANQQKGEDRRVFP